MNKQAKSNSPTIMELEWLAQYFYNHGRRDIALEILATLKDQSNIDSIIGGNGHTCRISGQQKRRSS